MDLVAAGAHVFEGRLAQVNLLEVIGMDFRVGQGLADVVFVQVGVGLQDSGAVHIELKHNVPNWDQADDCMWNVMRYGRTRSSTSDKVVKQLDWGGSKWARVVYNPKTKILITSYPWDGGSASSWSSCGQQ